MGTLTPGATYVYERNGEEIYAREVGKTERKMIGYQYENKTDPRTHDGRPLYEHLKEDKLWGEIRRAARTNTSLQEAMERVILIYHLSKDHGKNKHVDLFKDMIPAVDMGIKELWDAVTDEGRKEIKGDFWNLTRYISSVKSSNRELQEHFILTVNEYYNKNWNDIQQHPKLVWQTLCLCSHESKKTQFHEWIPLKKEANKKEKFLAELFPNMKLSDIETLAAITTDKEIKEYAKDLGWDKKQIADIKL